MLDNNGRSCISYWHILSAAASEHEPNSCTSTTMSQPNYGKEVYLLNRLVIARSTTCQIYNSSYSIPHLKTIYSLLRIQIKVFSFG